MYIAKTFKGLEEVLLEELKYLGAEDIKPLYRGVEFRGDRELLYAANLRCRTALRVLKPILSFKAVNESGLYNLCAHREVGRLHGCR
jgi:Predicted N6-adenine-specific DNA methylase